ncbi:hypothetical protein GOP47_0017858 [Adiantum capillus-veneris]|uniref:RNA helicase n=1 Tax=Adiantum capillus-veneris TaxID=13818 RepID=A0A9D4ZB82_ADICA|nr:hypothetical protein GOP47_0017858 [Adiantum capillus-veneris]
MRATVRYVTRSIVSGYSAAGLPPLSLRIGRGVPFLPFFSTTVETSTNVETCPPSEQVTLPSETPCDEMKGGGRKGGGGANLAPGLRPVSESSRITITRRLKEFRSGTDQKMAFESELDNHQRAIVHTLCKKMGLKSRSYGKGDDRRLFVWKPEDKFRKNKAAATSLTFSADARAAILQLFVTYPPTETEGSWRVDDTQGRRSKAQKSKQKPANNVLRIKTDIKKQVDLLSSRLQSMPALQKITQERAKLPIAKFKDEIISTIEKNQVVLIAGETGCGKTTQVPQYILDHLWSQGRPCRIICAQPRRISASSVAERIAAERGEPIGQTVGYQIKLESKGGPHSSLMFCTNGVILRRLVCGSGDVMSNLNATHLIVDEIHERDCDADFILLTLRDLLAAEPELRLILMSATIDVELFSSYFNNCPVVKIPGFTYPVQSFYLEDVLVATRAKKNCVLSCEEPSLQISTGSPLSEEDAAAMDEAIGLAWLEDDFDLFIDMLARNSSQSICNYQHSLTGTTPLMVAAGKGRVSEVLLLLSRGADMDLVSHDGTSALDWAERHGKAEVKEILLNHKNRKGDPALAAKKAEILEQYLSSIDQDEIDVLLIEQLLRKICTTVTAGIPPDHLGSILVFLPGWEDIARTRACLEASSLFNDPKKFLILPLHSMIPSAEQRKVFQTPNRGVRKIILATNIAETAITINDVVFVVDSGRVKEKSYDPYSNVSTFQTTWISKASAKQREGRAGRCQPGVCYHLYSKVRANSLPDFKVPEIKRMSVEELCLQVKLLDSNHDIKAFLCKALEPPDELSICNAIRLLQDIGALTPDQKLTELGEQLGSLPVHPSTSKMLLLGILLNCLGPALTIACASGYRDPFILPTLPEQRKRALIAKKSLANDYGSFSDDLAIVAAFNRWEKAKAENKVTNFCEKHFLSPSTMAMIAGMRQQLQKELAKKGFIPDEPNACSLNAHDPGIVRALVVAHSYPMVGSLLLPVAGKKPVVQTAQGMKVKIHPHSLVFNPITEHKMEHNPFLVFDEVTRGESWMYIRNCTIVRPHPLLLLSLEMVVAPLEGDVDEGDDSSDVSDEEDAEMEDREKNLMSDPYRRVVVVADRWLKFEATAVEAAQLFCLRERLAAAIAFKLKNPHQFKKLSRSSNTQHKEATMHEEVQTSEAVEESQPSSSLPRQKGAPHNMVKQAHLQLKTSINVTGHYMKRQRGDTLC